MDEETTQNLGSADNTSKKNDWPRESCDHQLTMSGEMTQPVDDAPAGPVGSRNDELTTSTSPDPGAKCKKVGHYLLAQSIGEGSYGKIRLATHLISKQQVAIKVVAKKLLVQREMARRHFRREALLLQHVHHPHVVRLYEAMETSNSYYLVFQLASGPSLLAQLSKCGQFSETETREYMRQIVSALDHLHRSGIVHRDIKLDNFLLDDENNIKIVDFGLSAVCHDSDHHLSSQCGSPVYSAPELFAGRKYGKAVDIWSLGVCYFAMLTGRLPFLPEDESSLPQLYSLILKGCVVPGHLSAPCQDLITRMLEITESRRITAEEMLTHVWLLGPEGRAIKRVPVVPKRLHDNVVNRTIVRYMCGKYRFNEADVITSVLDRKLTSAAATYHILKDGIDAGKVSIVFPKDSTDLQSSPNSRKSSDTLPPITTATSKPSTASSKESSVSEVTSANKKTPQQTTDSTQGSYKSAILVLKRARQHVRHSEDSNLPDTSDYVLVGKSPRNTSSQNNDVTCLSAGPDTSSNSSPFTLPPIVSNMAAWNAFKPPKSDLQGRKPFFHRVPPEVFHLDVKGVTPYLFHRNSFSSSVPSAGSSGVPARSLRDPFSRNTWNLSQTTRRLLRDHRLLKPHTEGEATHLNRQDSYDVYSRVRGLFRLSGHSAGTTLDTVQSTATEHRSADGRIQNRTGLSGNAFDQNDGEHQGKGASRNETDSPQELEEYFTPVTRVTITTIGRH
ncbi:serine/threonine-protein kinase par-1-like [Physella acuta]|uniref:serine/threonine-protein kinase par-1-like n=1 Tax=Physella acuta TaxID=109671 RepID=UPI0027DE62B8|nr:serine/threonine-protein kinase par-1-like [Physella acuta]